MVCTAGKRTTGRQRSRAGTRRRRTLVAAACCALLCAAALAVLLAPARAAFPGANGKIAFTSDRDGAAEIYTMNADGSGTERLNSPGSGPSFTSDGRRIAFASSRIGFSEVFVMNADGSGQVNVTNLGGDDIEPSFTPGSRIAYARNVGSFDIFSIGADGSGAVNLTNNPAGEISPAVSPDGLRIVFLRGFDVLVMNADGTNQTNLTNSAATEVGPAFSPDGGKIVYGSDRDTPGSWEIFVMNADGTNPVRLTNNTFTDDSPAFSPDGTKIAFHSDRDGNDEIYVMNADGTNVVRLTNNPAADREPDWGVPVPASAPATSTATTSTTPTRTTPGGSAPGSSSTDLTPPPPPPPPPIASSAATPPAATATPGAATLPATAARARLRREAARRRATTRALQSEPSAALAAQPVSTGTAAPAQPAGQEVQPSANPERSNLSNYFSRPDELFLSREDIEHSVGIAVLLLLLLGLPAKLFNKTVAKNRAELASWFGSLSGALSRITPRAEPRVLHLAAVSALLATAIYLFLDPQFPDKPGAAPYAVGMLLGFGVIIANSAISWRLYMALRAPQQQGAWVVYPGQIALSVLCVILSRVAHFIPGVLFGMAGEYEPRGHMATEHAGRRVLWTYSALATIGLTAWFASIPVAHAAEHEGASFALLAADAALAVIAIAGMETVVFGLVPLVFLDGHYLIRWRRSVWFALWSVGALWLAIVVVNPALSHHGEEEASIAWLAGLLAAQALVAVSVWAFFVVRGRNSAGAAPAHA
jgi:Tol biopolymer transport system component